MKKLVIGVLAGMSITCLVAMKSNFYDVKKSTAEVEQLQGIYVFSDSKPVSEFQYLGTVKTTFFKLGSKEYQGIRNAMIRKAKEDYPTCDGIIISFNDGGTNRADAIKFK